MELLNQPRHFLEVTGTIDSNRQLTLDRPLLEYKHDRGRVIVLLENDIDPDDTPTAEEHCSSHLSHIRLILSLSNSPI